jgi:hypothetical protein
MLRRKTKLGCPEVAAVIDDLHAKEPDGWRKNRLLAVKLAAKGEFTSDEIADLCGVSRTHSILFGGGFPDRKNRQGRLLQKLATRSLKLEKIFMQGTRRARPTPTLAEWTGKLVHRTLKQSDDL